MELNHRRHPFQGCALPTELKGRNRKNGAAPRTRTEKQLVLNELGIPIPFRAAMYLKTYLKGLKVSFMVPTLGLEPRLEPV
jgi:hypothetical protein